MMTECRQKGLIHNILTVKKFVFRSQINYESYNFRLFRLLVF